MAQRDELDDSSDPDYVDDEYDEDSKGFKVDDILDFPEAKTFTMAEIHCKIHDCEIDVNPPYQRDKLALLTHCFETSIYRQCCSVSTTMKMATSRGLALTGNNA